LAFRPGAHFRRLSRRDVADLNIWVVAHTDAIEDRPSEQLLDAWRFVRGA